MELVAQMSKELVAHHAIELTVEKSKELLAQQYKNNRTGAAQASDLVAHELKERLQTLWYNHAVGHSLV